MIILRPLSTITTPCAAYWRNDIRKFTHHHHHQINLRRRAQFQPFDQLFNTRRHPVASTIYSSNHNQLRFQPYNGFHPFDQNFGQNQQHPSQAVNHKTAPHHQTCNSCNCQNKQSNLTYVSADLPSWLIPRSIYLNNGAQHPYTDSSCWCR